jgi:hypothetical protein
MKKKWTIGAQLSTFHSPLRELHLDRMLDAVARVRAVIELDLLVLGSREVPEIFHGFTAPRRPVGEVFLWYNLLSDIEDMEESDLVVNWQGERSRGWGGWAESGAETSETFRFVCPNNPAPLRKSLRRLRELLSRYPFAGVFLDKIRYPSPANGIDEALSCFCDHCRRAARVVDLDLNAVAKLIQERAINIATASGGGSWLDAVAAANPLLARFLRFRVDSITRVVAQANEEARRLQRKVSLDLFSPCIAQLVGQDYSLLSRYCAWAKPMTYRVAKGPAGLRLEIPALAEGVARMFNIDESRVSNWGAANVRAFDLSTLRKTRDSMVPLPVIKEELDAAIQTMRPVPVYFGLELVSRPGVIDIKPAQVIEMVRAGRAAEADGLVISWDLMHAPMDGVRALATAI